MRWNGDQESAEDRDVSDLEEERSAESDNEYQRGERVNLLVVRRNLSAQAREEVVDEEQRDNLFHTRGVIDNKGCSIIIDNGSCTNCASSLMVHKLGLPTVKHPKPYLLHWMTDDNGIKVTKQVLVKFRIGKYRDEVLCDVVPMQASHILLGRPWQFDREANHEGKSNLYKIVKDGRKFTLAPLTQAEVFEDQQWLAKSHASCF